MKRTRAQESRAAIEKLYITMRHLFMRGSYKPMGVSGESLVQSLLVLKPEIYGLIDDEEKVELDGLLYVIERLPRGIDECRFVRLISREGYENSEFEAIVPPKRRRNCYRVDQHQMYVEMTRGRSDIYDILTHLTFISVEAEKILRNSIDTKNREKLDWKRLEDIVQKEERNEKFNLEAAYSYLANIIGRTYEETKEACLKFDAARTKSLFNIIYHLGKLAMDESNGMDREITFSATLRERVGHHVYGELWANHIKQILFDKNLLSRPIHIISANLHSITNTIFGTQALGLKSFEELEAMAAGMSQKVGQDKMKKVQQYALKNGLIEIPDTSGTNIGVQLIDTALMSGNEIAPGVSMNIKDNAQKPVIFVMDYAFGEQAFECLDELLKPFEKDGVAYHLNVDSVNIMGKAGILKGGKGDLMIPTAHVFEGTTDNYPIQNQFTLADFEGYGLQVFEGPMITVLGTSLQNKDVLKYFMESSWNAVGLEMEGAHYQKAVQAAAQIRKSTNENLVVRYAYYASDNPLETGSTLASGSLGMEGVRPTYLISWKILEKIFLTNK
jgi:hypothetical protein